MVSERDLCLSQKMPLMNDERMKKEYDQTQRKSVSLLDREGAKRPDFT